MHVMKSDLGWKLDKLSLLAVLLVSLHTQPDPPGIIGVEKFSLFISFPFDIVINLQEVLYE